VEGLRETESIAYGEQRNEQPHETRNGRINQSIKYACSTEERGRHSYSSIIGNGGGKGTQVLDGQNTNENTSFTTTRQGKQLSSARSID